MTDFGEGSKPNNTLIMDSMREKVGDPNFDPAKPNISLEKNDLTAKSIISDTESAYSSLIQTHHGERLEDLTRLNSERVELLFEALDQGEITREQLQKTLSRMFSIIDLGGIVDPMTFAERPDRKQWVFDNALRKAKKYDKQIYIIELDVSGFKGINDDPKHGHQTGDEVLKKIGSFLTQASYESIPQEDMPKQQENEESAHTFNIIRLGGDEFLVVEVGENDENLTKHKELIRNTPEKMRTICSELGISYEEHPIVFHSGVTIMHHDQDPEDAIRQADQELIINKAKYYEQNPQRTRRTT